MNRRLGRAAGGSRAEGRGPPSAGPHARGLARPQRAARAQPIGDASSIRPHRVEGWHQPERHRPLASGMLMPRLDPGRVGLHRGYQRRLEHRPGRRTERRASRLDWRPSPALRASGSLAVSSKAAVALERIGPSTAISTRAPLRPRPKAHGIGVAALPISNARHRSSGRSQIRHPTRALHQIALRPGLERQGPARLNHGDRGDDTCREQDEGAAAEPQRAHRRAREPCPRFALCHPRVLRFRENTARPTPSAARRSTPAPRAKRGRSARARPTAASLSSRRLAAS